MKLIFVTLTLALSLIALVASPFSVAASADSIQSASQIGWPTFRQTQSKEVVPEVKAIQFLLRARGLYSLQPDGIYGAQTMRAVKTFQLKRGLTVDGVVGPQTWPHLVVNLRRGARGDYVRAAQTLLRNMTGHSAQIAYPDLKVDGVFGAETEAATLDAQRYRNWFEHRVPENGRFGIGMWRGLTQKQSPQ